jgi:glutamate carboxypeptidase
VIEQARAFVAQKEWELFSLLGQLCGINSHTPNRDGTNEVGRAIRQAFLDIDLPGGVTVEVEERAEVGDILLVRTEACQRHEKQILFCGHMDTVFPETCGFDCVRPAGPKVVGPGVIDMKGGLVVAMYAAATLGHLGLLADMPVAFLFNSDEETGSLHSRDAILREAARSAFAFVFECGGLGGEVVTGRKGKVTYRVDVEGKAAHPGVIGGRGQGKSSAILAMAHKIVGLEALNEPEKGLSVNVGAVRGGTAANIVPDRAEALVDTRHVYRADGRHLDQAVRHVVEAAHAPGTHGSYAVVSERPAMEQNRANRTLFAVVRETGAALGQEIEEEFRGGVSDANFIAEARCPVIDGMGPCGDKDHSHEEYMVRASLMERTVLTALSAAECWKRHTDGTLF